MTNELAAIIGITTYKLACLAVGSLFCALGYRLFKLGIWGNAGDLDAKFNDTRLVLKSAAPGTFFAVLGAVIIVATVSKGIDFTVKHNNFESTMSTETPPPSLPEPKGESK